MARELLLILLGNSCWFAYINDVFESGILDCIKVNSVSIKTRARQPWKEIGAMTSNVRKSNRKRWAPEEVRYLRKNFGRIKLEELSRELGRDISSIKIAARALGLVKTKQDVRSKR